jgi:hypothetical protein
MCSAISHVRFASNSDRESGFPANGHVRFTPKSGHVRRKPSCLLWANSGLMHRSKKRSLFDHLIGAGDERRRDGEAN